MRGYWFTCITIISVMLVFSCKHPPEIPPVVQSVPAGLNYTPNAIQVQSGHAIASAQPVITGTQPMSYSLTTSNGLSVGHVTIDVNGIIHVDNLLPAGTYVFAVAVTNGAGTTTFYNAYEIMVSQSPILPSALSFTTDTLKINQGSPTVTSPPPAVKGTHPILYSISSSQSSLIAINDSTGAISADSGLAVGTYNVSITATNPAGTQTFTNVITIVINPVKPFNLRYAPNYMNIVSGSAISSVAPVIQGTTPIIYAISSSPVNSLITIDVNTGIITAGSGLAIGTYSVSVTASNAGGNVQFNSVYSIQVGATAQAPTQLSYSVNSTTINTGQTFSSVSPTIMGTTPLIFSLTVSPTTPSITINSVTGIIAASTNLTEGTYSISVTATNSAGSQVFSNVYTITAILAPLTGFSYSVNSLTIVDEVSGTSVVPVISGSLPITYNITSVLPANNSITINNSDGVISVAESSLPGTYTITVDAGNSVGIISTNYTVTVNPSFFNDILPLMKKYCTSCHNGNIEFTNYNSYVTTKGDVGNIISRCQSGSMPPGITPLTTEQINLIKLWQLTGMIE
jgi:hypothetical protein